MTALGSIQNVPNGTNQGRPARPLEEKQARGARLRALREALHPLTHQQVADRSGGAFTREKVSVYESGKNAMSTILVLRGLAKGLGVKEDDLPLYLDGKISLNEILKRRLATDVGRVDLAQAMASFDEWPPGLTVDDREWVASQAASEWSATGPRSRDEWHAEFKRLARERKGKPMKIKKQVVRDE